MSTSLNWNGGKAYQMISMNSGICKTGEKVLFKVKDMGPDRKEMAKLLQSILTGEVKMKPQTIVHKILGLRNFL